MKTLRPDFVTQQELRQELDALARKRLDMTADEVLELMLDGGDLDDDFEVPAVVAVLARLISSTTPSA